MEMTQVGIVLPDLLLLFHLYVTVVSLLHLLFCFLSSSVYPLDSSSTLRVSHSARLLCPILLFQVIAVFISSFSPSRFHYSVPLHLSSPSFPLPPPLPTPLSLLSLLPP
jgi:hypothetical protein